MRLVLVIMIVVIIVTIFFWKILVFATLAVSYTLFQMSFIPLPCIEFSHTGRQQKKVSKLKISIRPHRRTLLSIASRTNTNLNQLEHLILKPTCY